MNGKCPHCGADLEFSDMMYIEVCWNCKYAFDVAHGKEVEWGWFTGDGYMDDESENYESDYQYDEWD